MGLEIDLAVNKNENQTDIIQTVIEDVTKYFDYGKRKMGDPLLVGGLHNIIGNVSGVENVIDIRVYNLIGGQYSSAQIAQPYKDTQTKEIQQLDNTIYMKSNQIFKIRFPNKDIKVRVKTLGTTTF
jgi:hypothetical protein